jgi:hypothetical protein
MAARVSGRPCAAALGDQGQELAERILRFGRIEEVEVGTFRHCQLRHQPPIKGSTDWPLPVDGLISLTISRCVRSKYTA